ncbi:cupin domain-containing protein [Nocardioides sp. Kera G14]|uniref:cupin domain-containing protein n=1 Tax=Nocardioides sp. Kera G14 TaxID=2884264 RepID=UPI001D10F325|nr:cupin domain-containing protein [Nocardioides sp. Kera G14]UDY24568.1 cupin domain-containing protein [Nocardioides sp. Kera G14]
MDVPDIKPDISAVIAELGLEPHPEGGHYRQTWRSPVEVTLADGRVRAASTLIYFALPAGESSAWHKVSSDEFWMAHTGVVQLQYGGSGSVPVDGEIVRVGVDLAAGEVPQAHVPAGVWQRTVVSEVDAIVSCMVSPGFDFDDFALA